MLEKCKNVCSQIPLELLKIKQCRNKNNRILKNFESRRRPPQLPIHILHHNGWCSENVHWRDYSCLLRRRQLLAWQVYCSLLLASVNRHARRTVSQRTLKAPSCKRSLTSAVCLAAWGCFSIRGKSVRNSGNSLVIFPLIVLAAYSSLGDATQQGTMLWASTCKRKQERNKRDR